MYKKYIIISFFLIGVGFLIYNNPSQPPLIKGGEIQNPPDKGDTGGYLKIAGQNIKVDIADTPALREQGLSGRQVLGDSEGMLFVFPQSGTHGFWMKDMNFAIDIIWIGEDMKVVYIEKDAQPDSYPNTFGPNENAKYVLEVSAGFSEKNNVKVGDRVEFDNF